MYVYAFDIDGTLTPIKSSWWFVKLALNLGHRSKNYSQYFFNGLICYDEWVFLELQLLKGLGAEVFKNIVNTIPWRYGIERLIEFRRSRARDFFIAITGGFSFLGERAVKELGFDAYIGAELDIENGKLVGTSKNYIDFHGKGLALLDYLYLNNVEFDKLICIGDNVNDIDMFRYCDISIAFCPSDHIKESDVSIYISSCNIRKLVEILSTII